MEKQKCLVLGHRGAAGRAPENTMPAFQMALDMNADGVELDVQLTKDDQIVVIHDETIDRTSNGAGWVKDFTLEELRRFNYNYQNRTSPWTARRELGDVVYGEYEFVNIPTMREVFELFKGTEKLINIELKTGVVFYDIEEKLLALTKEMKMESRVIYSSFNHYSIKKIQRLNPDARTGFLYADGPIDMPAYAKKHGVSGVHPALYNLQYDNFMRDCKANGLDVHVWTVNTREHLELCKNLGVTSVITDYPDLAAHVMNQ